MTLCINYETNLIASSPSVSILNAEKWELKSHDHDHGTTLHIKV